MRALVEVTTKNDLGSKVTKVGSYGVEIDRKKLVDFRSTKKVIGVKGHQGQIVRGKNRQEMCLYVHSAFSIDYCVSVLKRF